jgi:hypothetical protein
MYMNMNTEHYLNDNMQKTKVIWGEYVPVLLSSAQIPWDRTWASAVKIKTK